MIQHDFFKKLCNKYYRLMWIFQKHAVHKTRFAQWLNINNEGILVKAFLFMGESWQAAHVNSRKVIVQKPQGNSLLVDSWNKRLSCVRTNSHRGKSRYHCVHNHFILANIDILNLPFTKQLDSHILWNKNRWSCLWRLNTLQYGQLCF